MFFFFFLNFHKTEIQSNSIYVEEAAVYALETAFRMFILDCLCFIGNNFQFFEKGYFLMFEKFYIKYFFLFNKFS